MKILDKIRLAALICVLILCVSCKKEDSPPEVSGETEETAECIVTLLKGTAYITAGDSDEQFDISVGDRLTENQAVVTGANSTVELQIGEGSVIRIKEDSKVVIQTLYADAEQENTGLFLETGKILAEPELQSEESSFEVTTNTVTAGVRGTEFVIVEQPGKVTKIAVNEGKVSVKKELTIDNIDTLKKLNPEVVEELEQAMATEIVLEPDEKLEVSEEKVKEIEQKVEAQVTQIIEKLEQAAEQEGAGTEETAVITDIESINITEISALVGESIEKETVSEAEWETEFNKKEFEEIQIKSTAAEDLAPFKSTGDVKTSFSVRDTFISADETNIYFTSAGAGTVVCYNPASDTTSWVFTNPGEAKLNSPAIPYKNTLILGTFNSLYVLDKQTGRALQSFDLEKGPVFWAAPITAGGKIFIPTSRKVYSYDGNTFTDLKKISPAKGQMYINSAYNLVFINEGQAKRVKVYNLVSGTVIYEASDLLGNAYMKPAVVGDAFILADRDGRIYKYKYGSKDPVPQIMKISAGIVSSFAVQGNKVFFIALDGKLYQMNGDIFSSPAELITAEEKPGLNTMLVKSPVIYRDRLYYAAQNGKVLTYSLTSSRADFIETSSRDSLIGSPVLIDNTLYVINSKGKVFSKPVE